MAPAENQTVTPLAGLRAVGAGHGATVDYQAELAGALAAAAGYDAVVLVVAMQHTDEGEGYGGGDDRESLDLAGPHPEQWVEKPRAWIEQLTAQNPNLIVVLNVGGAIVEPSLERARALLYSFYPGQSGGTALGRLLFGEVNFSGKLPFTIATDPSQYPVFGDSGTVATYDYLHGYRKFDREALTPRYWFGSGITYTSFSYSNLTVPCDGGVTPGGTLIAEVDVENTGAMAGTEIVQLYVGIPELRGAPLRQGAEGVSARRAGARREAPRAAQGAGARLRVLRRAERLEHGVRRAPGAGRAQRRSSAPVACDVRGRSLKSARLSSFTSG